MWRGGELYRLPGTSRTQASMFNGYTKTVHGPAVSHDGSSVAFEAVAPLLPQDGDVVFDVYVARVGGGFAQPDPPPACAVLADGCQGGGPAAIAADAKTSSSTGGENASVQRKTLALAGLSRKARKRAARSGVLAVRLRSSSPGRVRLVVRAKLGKRSARIARETVGVRKAGAMTVKLRLNRAARSRLASGKRLRVTVEARQSGARSRAMSVLLPGAKS
jgi:hypothetical protein